ncbi:hypothetical protein PR048_029510 [Dryococelus australis]|uniref:Uncharacterized protein n=1 Tax=Dryococelus australis TaxID=614101 RepID=A0ABQ9GDJ1_9NEOP|nr:hypothetical protein PR048_029510 [Dryococelus australis]
MENHPVTYSPNGSPANRQPLATRRSQPDARPVPRASRSQSENGLLASSTCISWPTSYTDAIPSPTSKPDRRVLGEVRFHYTDVVILLVLWNVFSGRRRGENRRPSRSLARLYHTAAASLFVRPLRISSDIAAPLASMAFNSIEEKINKWYLPLFFQIRAPRMGEEREGVAATEWLDCSPTTMANRVQSLAGPFLDFRKWESYRTMPLVGGFFSGISRFPRPFIPALLHSHPHFTLIGSQDLVSLLFCKNYRRRAKLSAKGTASNEVRIPLERREDQSTGNTKAWRRRAAQQIRLLSCGNKLEDAAFLQTRPAQAKFERCDSKFCGSRRCGSDRELTIPKFPHDLPLTHNSGRTCVAVRPPSSPSLSPLPQRLECLGASSRLPLGRPPLRALVYTSRAGGRGEGRLFKTSREPITGEIGQGGRPQHAPPSSPCRAQKTGPAGRSLREKQVRGLVSLSAVPRAPRTSLLPASCRTLAVNWAAHAPRVFIAKLQVRGTAVVSPNRRPQNASSPAPNRQPPWQEILPVDQGDAARVPKEIEPLRRKEEITPSRGVEGGWVILQSTANLGRRYRVARRCYRHPLLRCVDVFAPLAVRNAAL